MDLHDTTPTTINALSILRCIDEPAGVQVLASLRTQLIRVLLLQRVDLHDTTFVTPPQQLLMRCAFLCAQEPPAGVQVLASLRTELFRVLLLQRVDFYDATSTAELTGLLSTELDTVRSFLLNNVSRDRGLRAILEASGAVRLHLTQHPALFPASCLSIST